MIEVKKLEIPLKGVIFDLDGTLVNTLEDIADTMNAVLRANAMPEHPTEKYKFLVGEGIFNLTKRVMPENRWSEENASSFVQEFRTLYDITWHDKSVPYDGIVPLLQKLHESGIKIGVLSNKPDQFVQKIVGWFFPNIPFTSIYGEVKDVPAKPDPSLAIRIAESMKLSTKEIAMIGDSGIDVQTGINAGMIPIGVSWGFRPVEELISSGASFVVDTPEEIHSIIKKH